MTEPWYPLATRDPATVDGGSYADGYPRRGVLHTTEGTTYEGARETYAATGSWPHLTVSYQRGWWECWQHISLDRAARALRNAPGGVETNRGGALQIEIVGTCDPRRRGQGRWLYVDDFPPGYLAGIARLMRWLEQRYGIRRLTPPVWLPYPASYGVNGLRVTDDVWRRYRGWLGHMHVPEQTHGDPGSLAIQWLLQEESMQVDPQVDRLIEVVKDQTGSLYQQRNSQHGDVMRALNELPDRIAQAFVAVLEGTDKPD